MVNKIRYIGKGLLGKEAVVGKNVVLIWDTVYLWVSPEETPGLEGTWELARVKGELDPGRSIAVMFARTVKWTEE